MLDVEDQRVRVQPPEERIAVLGRTLRTAEVAEPGVGPREGAASMGHGDPQLGMPFEDAAEHQCVGAERGVGHHAEPGVQMGGRAPQDSAPMGHRVHEDAGPARLARGPETIELRVVEVEATHRGPDLEAPEPKRQQTVELALDVVRRHAAQPEQPSVRLVHPIRHRVVRPPRVRRGRRPGMLHQSRQRGDDLVGHACAVQLPKARGDVPQRVGDGASRGRRHQVASTPGVRPRPGTGDVAVAAPKAPDTGVVGVHVDQRGVESRRVAGHRPGAS